MIEVIARSLRGLRQAWTYSRSGMLLAWYKMLYPGLTVGRRVRIGRGVHISVVRGATLAISDGVVIEQHCQLVTEGSLSIGADSFVGAGTIIVAAERVIIGRDALIAAYVVVRDQDHRTGDALLPYNEQPLVMSPVRIGDNVWIGTKATVLKGVTIGNGAVVGAHSLVNRDVDPGSIVAGVPARHVANVEDRAMPVPEA